MKVYIKPLHSTIHLPATFFFVIVFSAAIFSSNPTFSQPWVEHGRLTVKAANPHYIAFDDGKPFFWFGDTAWELFHRLSREEAALYLQNRKKKGFNVIQAVAISEFHENKKTNFYGDSLFVDNDVLQPLTSIDDTANGYWDHLRYIINLAKQEGLYIGLLPTWGEWVTPRQHRALFNTPKDGYKYGWFLSNYLKEFPNIIWILGGDRNPDETKNGIDIWRAMAEGITDAINGDSSHDGRADYNATFMTHHSFTSSSKWFHKDPWIDLHMWGSYHSDYYLARSYQQAAADWSLLQPKPTINGEPAYENHPVNYALAGNGFFTEVDVRNAAYWSMFAGCAGYTYGAHPIWQFSDDKRPAYSTLTIKSWQEALHLPGAGQITYLKALMTSKPSEGLTPDQTMIVKGQGAGADYVCAIRSKSHALFYIPTGAYVTVKLGVISGTNISASWFDPRTGSTTLIGTYPNKGDRAFDVPGISKEVAWLRSGRGCDWVLVIEDASKSR